MSSGAVGAGPRPGLPTALEFVQSPKRVDKAEPAHEPFVRTPLGAEPSAYRLAVEIQVEPHAQRAILIGAGLVFHWADRTRASRLARRGAP
jgi:hypothetical protein